MRHVLDREVGDSNSGESVSFLPGCRLDLPILLDGTNHGGVTHLWREERKYLNNQLQVGPSNNIIVTLI